MPVARYLGSKAVKYDNVAWSGTSWAAGEAKVVSQEVADKLAGHPAVWEINNNYDVVLTGSATFNAATAGTDAVLFTIPGNVRARRIDYSWGALGASTGLEIGYDADTPDPNAFADEADSALAGIGSAALDAYYGEARDCIATVTDATSASSDIVVRATIEGIIV